MRLIGLIGFIGFIGLIVLIGLIGFEIGLRVYTIKNADERILLELRVWLEGGVLCGCKGFCVALCLIFAEYSGS